MANFAQDFIAAIQVKEFRDAFQKLVVNAIRQESAENGAIANSIKANSGGDISGALEEAFADGGSFYKGGGPYARLNETIYEQTGKVLDERGFPKDK